MRDNKYEETNIISKLGKLEKVNLRNIWPNEEYDFSVWLSKEENLKELSDTIGIDIVLEERESAIGKYSVDIYAKEDGTIRCVPSKKAVTNFEKEIEELIFTNKEDWSQSKLILSE